MVMLLTYGGVRGSHDFNLDIDVTNLPLRREALEEVCRPVPGVHGRAKHIAPEMVAKALDNEPFEDYTRMDYAWKRMCDEKGEAKERFNQSYRKAVENFLRRTYHSLTFIPEISFDIEKISEVDERKAIEAARKSLNDAYVMGQGYALEEAYTGLCALRTVFANSGRHEYFSIETVISSRYVPELLVIAPVWFIASKRGNTNRELGEYFCDLCATDQFAYLFQMYNRDSRLFDQFEGRDIMPLPISELVGKVKNLFDFLVIATPYHDIVSSEWGDAHWTRNIDPFLFGFLRQVPEVMFFLGRWSGTGLFPLIGDMIADTIGHIKKNKGLLVNFTGEYIWYRQDANRNVWR